MSLRTKWTIGLAGLVASLVLLSGFAANAFIREELRGETDVFLNERVDLIEGLFRNNGGRGGLPGRPRRTPRTLGGEFTQFDSVTQVIDRDGEILINEGRVDLPVSDGDLEIARSDRRRAIRDVEVDGVEYRMITAPLSDRAAVQIARDTTETAAVLTGVRRRLWFAGLGGAALAGLVGWFGAGRAIRPVRRVTAAAEGVARTQDLSEPLPVDGNDEVARLSASFNTMMGALRHSRDQQHQLVMDASHELRTPLTSLRTSIEVLERGIPDGDTRNRLLANASSELRELTALVSELVELATDQSPTATARVQVGLAAAAEQAADRGRQRHGRPITVQADSAATVLAAPEAIDRALNNLIDNAAKFSADGTPIEVSVNGLSIEVRDHGEGMAADDVDFVFDRFYRADTSRTLPGSGLGLAIVRQIATDHDGDAWARNHPSGGAVVGFSLGESVRL